MVNYRIVKYSSQYYQEWNEFVSKAKNATFLFHRDFMDYHSNRFEDYSLLVFKEKTLIALLPANKLGSNIYSHQGLSYGGLILKSDIKFQPVFNIFKTVLEYLSTNNLNNFEVKLIPSIYSQIPNDEIQYLMFLLEAKLIKKDTLSVINLEENIKFSKNRIEGCKRAAKHDLIIKDDDDFESFWNEILIPNLKTKYNTSPVHSLKEIKLLKEKFPNNIKQFNVYYKNKIVAGSTMFISKKVAHCQYISGNSNNNQLGSLDVLFEYLIKKVFVNKKYFDFGSSNSKNGKQINRGLQYWKEGFGSRTITQDFYSISINNYKKLENIMI